MQHSSARALLRLRDLDRLKPVARSADAGEVLEHTRQRAHLCLVHVEGEQHTLALLDPMLQVAEALEGLGTQVTTGRNRLRHGAVNLVFGAHLGFDPALADDYDCVFVNLEQLGAGGKPVSQDYLRLLARHDAVDYHELNPPAYGRSADDVPLLTFGHSPAKAAAAAPPLRDRPIDLLFIGALLPRRHEVLRRLKAIGLEVVVPSSPLYGPERDALVRSARAVLNVAAYDVSRFEQVRASLCLSLGTPVVSERRPLLTASESAFEPYVSWFDADHLEEWFSTVYRSPAWTALAEHQVVSFPALRTSPSVAAAWQVLQLRRLGRSAPAPAPSRVTLATSARGYRMGWLNASRSAHPAPDLLVDRWSDLQPGTTAQTEAHGPVRLGSAELVELDGDSGPLDLVDQVAAALRLLVDGGRAVVDLSPGADTRRLEQLLDEPWRAGSATHRFELAQALPVDRTGRPCPEASATAVRLELVRRPADPAQVTAARTLSDDLGGLLTPAPRPVVLGARSAGHLALEGTR